MKNKKNGLLYIQHFSVAFILIANGFAKIEENQATTGWVFLLLGGIIMFYVFLLKFSKRNLSVLKIIIYFCESIALLLTTLVYFQDGKTFLPYLTLLAAIGFLVAAIVHLIKFKPHLVKENY